MSPALLPPSVNFHLWQPCNMRCRFCFATFHDVLVSLPKGHLPREQALAVTRVLATRFRKVTFAGGEPTLCPWIDELIRSAHEQGTATMLVTNGSRLDDARLAALAGVLDWLALSVDSADPATHVALGRAEHGRALPTQHHVDVAGAARRRGIRVKLNTVVTALNAGEELSALVRAIRPERWKVLRALPVEGQNSGKIEPLLCSAEAFAAFVERHRHLAGEGIAVVPEDHEDVRGAYAMVGPDGRFFDNVDGGHTYGPPILEVGLDAAFAPIRFSHETFARRGGLYDFRGSR